MNINGANYKVQNQHSLSAQIFSKDLKTKKKDNFNPDEWANTNGMKGMYIGGGKQWKKIIDVSDKAKADLAKVVKEDFISTNGKGIPEGSKRNDVIVNYLRTITADKRSSASWTLERMAADYAARLESAVRQQNPNWKAGDAFDISILDTVNENFGLDYKG